MKALGLIFVLLVGSVTAAREPQHERRQLAPRHDHRVRRLDDTPDGPECGKNGNTYCTADEACTVTNDCVVICGLQECWQDMQDSWLTCPGGGCVCQ